MTDRTDFETKLERRMRAYAATATHPVRASDVARATMSAGMVGRSSLWSGSRRSAILIGLAALLMLVVAGAAFVGKQRPVIDGTFVPGPTLAEGRIVDAVTLADGRVLVGVLPEEGTVNGTTTLRCSTPCWQHLALLDPRTGDLTMTHEQPRSLDTTSMALLGDGRVLLLARWPDGTDGPSTIYDPVSDRFEEVGPSLHARSWPLVVPLADGRVLVAGSGTFASSAAELFDPATGTFSPVGSMGQPRGGGASATRLHDGRVLVVGGGPEVGTSAELFDPVTATFSPTGSMTVGRGGFHTATLLEDGRVLLAGGLVASVADPQTIPEATATAEIYDPATGTFSAVGPMRSPRHGHGASILADGTVLVVGGGHELREGTPVPVADAEIFDPATGAFRSTGSLRLPRLLPTVVRADDRVLVLGGFDLAGMEVETRGTTEWFQ